MGKEAGHTNVEWRIRRASPELPWQDAVHKSGCANRKKSDIYSMSEGRSAGDNFIGRDPGI